MDRPAREPQHFLFKLGEDGETAGHDGCVVLPKNTNIPLRSFP
jgi:hypothetical protein